MVLEDFFADVIARIFTVLGDTPIAAPINGCVIKLSRATPSGCADAALGVFSRRCFQPPDLALGAFDHLFPPNKMIRGNRTVRPEDKSLRCPLSEKHLHRYVAEFDIRYSNRVALGMNDMERAEKLARGIVGKRLTYRRSNEAGL
jgi:hypothetical protein